MNQFRINEQQNFLQEENLKQYKSLNQIQEQRKFIDYKLMSRSSLKIRNSFSDNQLEKLFTIRRKSSILEDKYQTQQTWEKRERESKRLDNVKVQKQNEIERLSSIVVILILFFLALNFAPNQFYSPEEK